MDGRELIHDAAARAYEFIFGLLAEQGEFGGIERYAGVRQERQRAGDFDRGGGA